MGNMIKVLAMDVDGTLTDGKINIGERGEIYKSFDVRDGLGIKMAKDYGIIPIIITGRQSAIVTKRAQELGIEKVFQGVENKQTVLEGFCKEINITGEQLAYIGDDVNDLAAMSICGLTACPADAHARVRNSVNFICKVPGGQGAVREFIEYIIGNN